MTTTVSTKGQIVLPAEFRLQDGIEPGQVFDVERIDSRRISARAPQTARKRRFRGLAVGLSREGLFRPHRIGIHGYAVIYLVDANVLSEATKAKPEAKVVDWLRHNEADLAVDPIILGEIRFGIHLLPSGKRRRRLEAWFEDGVAKITCLPWGAKTGLRWARLLADLRSTGKAMPIKDSMIAATALVHGLTVATRNHADYRVAGVKLLNPFV